MQLDITGHHVDITDSMREYVAEKVGRITRHFDNVTDIHVILSVEKQSKKAEATVQVKGGKIYADALDDDMYAAIDSLADKLDRQVIKHKEKIKSHRGKGGKDQLQEEETE
ncbi:MAG: ribosome-associated translation inhibitor RaiA [Gammaproteobacteria bacterium]|nr:ribosome-associated translation inhibitor RaiA [Gammaproteobacteria bacterium]